LKKDVEKRGALFAGERIPNPTKQKGKREVAASWGKPDCVEFN